jgi:tetratricopeptide (TPR) repeat protein
MSAPDDTTAPSTPAPDAITSAPAGADAVQTEPDSAPAPPAAEPARSPTERFILWRWLLDGALVAVVLLLAFEVGFFPVRNSDLLMHRAVGRLVAQGEFDFHSDPFAYTTEGVRWVDHSWLFGFFAYGMHKIAEWGDGALIGIKALLLAALAELMLRLARRPGRSLWVPGLCIGLAVLALSPRATLHSGCVSYLFLGLTLYLLDEPRRRLAQSAPGAALPFWNVRWLIVPLCALWVNCDAWFLLGPVTVGLFLLGELLEGSNAPKGGVANLGAVLAASVIACLASPYHVYALSLPEQLGFSPPARELQDTVPFSSIFFGPVRNINDFFAIGVNRSVAGLTYFPLVLLGIISFAISPGSWRNWRGLVWLSFFLLSAWHGRAIPFFAIAAGPITSLNFLERFAGDAAEVPADADRRRRLLTVRLLTFLLAIAAFTAGSAGWLHMPVWGPDPSSDSRRPGWWVDFDQSLVKAAEQVASWRKDNLVPADARWFNSTPDVGNFFAWYAPGVRTFIDGRLSLYSAETARDFREARKALYPAPPRTADAAPESPNPVPNWAPVFSAWNIAYLVVAEGDLSRRAPVHVQFLMGQRSTWTLCYLFGGTAVFGWNDAKGMTAASYSAIRYDADSLAFGPHPEAAPGKRPPTVPAPQWWQVIWQPERPRSTESDNAGIHMLAFTAQVERKSELDSRDADLRLALAAGGPFGPLANGALNSRMLATRVTALDPGPPGELYLAVRAARRALEVNSEDGQAWYQLGRAYSALSYRTREQLIGFTVPILREVRQAQMVTAMTRAVRWNPDQDAPHALLASQFQSRFVDLTLLHREAELKALNTRMIALAARNDSSPELDEGKQMLQDHIEAITEEVKRLQAIKKDFEDRFELDTANKPPLLKAQTAERYGLAEAALKAARDHLQQIKDGSADPQLAAPGLAFLLRLLIGTGEIDEARALVQQEGGRDLINRSQDRSLPVPPELACDWYSVVIDAAAGDYANADETLHDMVQKTSMLPTAELAASLGDHLLFQATSIGRVNSVSSRTILALRAALGPRIPAPPLYQVMVPYCLDRSGRHADLETARGWLALESGDTETARHELIDVMAQANKPRSSVRNFHSRPLAEMLLKWIEADRGK